METANEIEAHVNALLGLPPGALRPSGRNGANVAGSERGAYEKQAKPTVEEAAVPPEDADFFNALEPNVAVLTEQPIHRVMIYLTAQGISNNEIARRTGYTAPHVSQVLRQPWARARLAVELRDAGQDAVQSLIKSAAEDSVFTLMEVRDDKGAPAAARVACANSLLDRFLGKPTQRVESNNTNLNVTVDSVVELDRQIAALEAEEKQLMAQPSQRN